MLCVLIHIIFTPIVFTQNVEEYNGPATIQYFQQQSISISNLSELTCSEGYFYFDYDLSDGTNVYFGETKNGINIVKYYKVYITPMMKQMYKTSMYVSTCCDQMICDIFWNESYVEHCNEPLIGQFYEWYQYLSTYNYNMSIFSNSSNYTEQYEKFCRDTSLDTVLYLLQEKKGQLTLIETNDDSTCSNTHKSHINLLNYPEGEYIIAIGGFAKENGSYFLQMVCLQHSIPLTVSQLNPPTNTTSITCNKTIYDVLTPVQSVQYHLFNITKNTYLPINIYVPSYGMFLYLIKSVVTNYATESHFEIVAENYYDGVLIIDESILPTPTKNHFQSTYYIVVQGLFSDTHTYYNLSIECGNKPTEEPTLEPTIQPSISPNTSAPTQAEKIPYTTLAGIVFSVCGIIFMIFLGYYIYEWRKYKKDKQSNKSTMEKQGSNFESLPQEENTDDDEFKQPEPKHIKTTQLQPLNITSAASSITSIQKSKQDDWDRRITRNKSSVAGVTIRRIDKDMQISEQLSHDEDIIQLVVAHAMRCCEDQSGFDIYQVLSVRVYEKDSRRVIGWSPLKQIGINIEFIKLSPFFLTCLQAIFIALTQAWGITVVVYKLIASYWQQGEGDDICNMDAQRWVEVWSLKILSFLLSLSITFYIRILMNGLQNNGLYKIMDQLSLNDYHRIDTISLWCVQLGQMVNYYVCLWAIIGSYFIIFAGNRGEINEDTGDIDYANTGLEMILNAVALFFMLELDDMMVTEQDYIDCGDHLAVFLRDYEPDISINKYYSRSLDNILDEAATKIADEAKHDHEFPKKRSDTLTDKAYNKCLECMLPTMYYLVKFCSIFVPFCCYCGGFIAPFLIFFCW